MWPAPSHELPTLVETHVEAHEEVYEPIYDRHQIQNLRCDGLRASQQQPSQHSTHHSRLTPFPEKSNAAKEHCIGGGGNPAVFLGALRRNISPSLHFYVCGVVWPMSLEPNAHTHGITVSKASPPFIGRTRLVRRIECGLYKHHVDRCRIHSPSLHDFPPFAKE